MFSIAKLNFYSEFFSKTITFLSLIIKFLCVPLILGQQAQPQSAAANKTIYYYERSGSNSPQISQPYHHQGMQRDHLASDSLVLNTSASSKYVNLPSGGTMQYMHNASASLPVANTLPPKFNRQLQSPSKDYVQINPPAMYANPSPIPPPSQGTQSPSRSIGRSYQQQQVSQSPTKSISSAGSTRTAAMEEINGSDYVCMSGGTLTKKLQQEKGSTGNLPTTTQVIYQRPPPVPPLKTNYTTPANELPQAQYSTAADKQIADAIAVAKKSVNLNKIASAGPATTTSPTPLAMGPGKGSK